MAEQTYNEIRIFGRDCRQYDDFAVYDVYGNEVEIPSLSELAMEGGLEIA